jgi:formate dehydrogenase major subunit
MELNRREFLKASGAGVGGIFLLGALNPDIALARTVNIPPLKTKVTETTTICCYCAVGCGAVVATYEDGPIKIEGDPDHPINEGTLCSKGQALPQFHTVDGEDNPNRLTKPLYRAAGGTTWQEVEWDWAIDSIAQRIKKTRDDNWLSTINVGGTTYPVNRTDAIANFGGGELDNEECYLLVKMARALGLVYIEHCARI